MTKEQYEAALKKYPILGDLYHLVREFYKILFSHKSEELDSWLNGITADKDAVLHAIEYPYSNGLAEGSVNKSKLIKRIMYGRSSFSLLRAKILWNEFFYS